MPYTLCSIEEDADGSLPMAYSRVFVSLNDCLQCYVRLERCVVPPPEKDEEKEQKDNAHSPTHVAAQIRERREELDLTPPLSVQPPEQQTDRCETPLKGEYDGRYCSTLSLYDPVYDISPLRGFHRSPYKIVPAPSSTSP